MATSISPILKFLEKQEWSSILYGYYIKFSTTAEEWMTMARKDLEMGNKHGRANALGNAKRAVENRIDTLIWGYGLSSFAKNKSWNFPGAYIGLNLLPGISL